MRENNTRAFSSVGSQVRFERDRRRKKRNIIICVIAALSLAIATFAFLIFAELFGWFEKDPGVDKPIDSEKNKFEYEEILVPSSDVHKGGLILINSSFPYVFPDTPSNFLPLYTNRNKHEYINAAGEKKTVYSYYTQSAQNCAKLEPETLKALNAMADDFFKATNNIDLFIFDEDGYRSKDDQSASYAENPVMYARPGESEHHLGTSTDLYVYTADGVRGSLDDAQFAATFKWIYDNAYKYGFVLRYPDSKSETTGVTYEPYHFRNVGYAHAYYMTENDLCLEEYLDLLRDEHAFDGTHLEFTGDDGNSYTVYYVPASTDGITTLKVPKNTDGKTTYTVSGDNKDGFIVTVTVEK